MSQANASDSLKSKLEGGGGGSVTLQLLQSSFLHGGSVMSSQQTLKKSENMTCSNVFSLSFIQFNSTEAEFMNVQFR